MHLCVIALNFLHQRAPFSTLPTMRRCPGVKHVQVYARIMALCRACGPTEEVSILGCGRKSHQLSARFDELLQALQRLGLEQRWIYGGDHIGQHVPAKNDIDELVPYRPLSASRLKLTGQQNGTAGTFCLTFSTFHFVSRGSMNSRLKFRRARFQIVPESPEARLKSS